MKNRDCKIVQDLLPNCIENLTTEETNKFIESHLNGCKECKDMYENMKKKIPTESDKLDKKRVNFFKKYRNKLRFLRIIILVCILIAVAVATRKIIIVNQLSKLAEESIANSNVHRASYSMSGNSYSMTNMYSMDNKIKIVVDKLQEGKITHSEMYFTKKDGTERYFVNIYKTIENEKTVQLNHDMAVSAKLSNPFIYDNLWQKLIFPATSSIKETTFNGEACYLISGAACIYYSGESPVYISKKTGLGIATQAYEFKDSETGEITRWPASETKYEFGTVTENDFIEPDISEYTIIE